MASEKVSSAFHNQQSFRTCTMYSLNSGVMASLSWVATPAIWCSCGPPCSAGKTAWLILEPKSRSSCRTPRGRKPANRDSSHNTECHCPAKTRRYPETAREREKQKNQKKTAETAVQQSREEFTLR